MGRIHKPYQTYIKRVRALLWKLCNPTCPARPRSTSNAWTRHSVALLRGHCNEPWKLETMSSKKWSRRGQWFQSCHWKITSGSLQLQWLEPVLLVKSLSSYSATRTFDTSYDFLYKRVAKTALSRHPCRFDTWQSLPSRTSPLHDWPSVDIHLKVALLHYRLLLLANQKTKEDSGDSSRWHALMIFCRGSFRGWCAWRPLFKPILHGSHHGLSDGIQMMISSQLLEVVDAWNSSSYQYQSA